MRGFQLGTGGNRHPWARTCVMGFVIGLLLAVMWVTSSDQGSAQRPILYWGSYGSDVRLLQWRLQSWGYYRGPIDGSFGNETARAVRRFQANNGLTPDGLVGPSTWAALGYPSPPVATAMAAAYTPSQGVVRSDEVALLARLIAAEARGENYVGQVSVAAVVLNRVASPRFPNTVAGVIFQPAAFESVSNGLFWSRTPNATELKAARDAVNGWDPTGGALFFWNPYKPVSGWIWSRPISVQYGKHVFAM